LSNDKKISYRKIVPGMPLIWAKTEWFYWDQEVNDILFFSAIADISTVEKDYLKEHPEFNQVLHDLPVETAEEMIAFILQHAPEETMGV
jgi:hypothetical protein